MAIVSQIRNFIDTHQVVCAGPFVYAYVEEVQWKGKCWGSIYTACQLAVCQEFFILMQLVTLTSLGERQGQFVGGGIILCGCIL